MKQLLETCDDNLFIAGLNDRAYVVVTINKDSSPVVCELLPPDTAKEGDARETKNQKQDEEEPNLHEVQAVAIQRCSDGKIWCAVSRRNKVLSLYEFVASGDEKSTLSPSVSHSTAKRVCCLSFASVPASTGDAPDLDVIVAGDLVGDAIAYPLTTSLQPSEAAKNGDSDDTTLLPRLLLGHTASILTAVKLVKVGDSQCILTSDRDEKVRVSQFPQTNVIEGYLLGHTAFVAAMDATTHPDCYRCVTCSGDGTIRLWDYKTHKQLDRINISENSVAAEGGEEAKGDQGDYYASLVPTAISISPNGAHVAVIFDKTPTIYLYTAMDGVLKRCQTLECDTPLLAAKFVDNQRLFVVTTEPNYLLSYKCTNDIFAPCVNDAVCETLAKTAITDGVSMPTTVLETDKKGKARLKLKEKEERSRRKPWNNVERIQIAKERNARRRKRKRDEPQGDNDEAQDIME